MVDEAKQLLELLSPELFTAKTFSLEVSLSGLWNPKEIVTLKQSGDEINVDKAPVSVLSALLERQWDQQKSVQLQLATSSLRLIDGYLWQCHVEGISVFTLDLDPVRQISSGEMGWIHDVASTGREDVVVAADNRLYKLNKEEHSEDLSIVGENMVDEAKQLIESLNLNSSQ